MPAYSFKPRFVPFVKDGTKTQTVRRIRKYPPRKGQPTTLLTGSRFKPQRIREEKPLVENVDTIVIGSTGKMFLLKNIAITQEQEITIRAIIELSEVMPNEFKIHPPYNFYELSNEEKDLFAWMDGFRTDYRSNDTTGCFDLMFRWFQSIHTLPFVGHVTYWKF